VGFRKFVVTLDAMTRSSLRRPLAVAATLTLLTAVLGVSFSSAAGAQAPPEPAADPAVEAAAPSTWVVSVGDSYISGEGGRWAGNANGFNSRLDALGSNAYYDNADGTAELIERCHRSRSAAIHIGNGVQSKNFACSGAETITAVDEDGNFKPGVDFKDLGGGRVGQARMLQDFAATNQVKMVVLSIGGNDFKFGPIVEQCVKDFLKPALWGLWPHLCSEDSDVTGNMSAANAANVRSRIVGAIGNVQAAMRNAGTPDGQWTLVVQTYPQVLPHASDMRYTQTGYERQSTGGCGFSDSDVNWALNVALSTINRTVKSAIDGARAASPANRIEVLDNTATFQQRGLCDASVARLGAYPVGQVRPALEWTEPGAVDRSEWVTEINILTVASFFKQESLHPNYWGQLALRNCVRQIWNGGNVVGGSCVRGQGLNTAGEPNMSIAGRILTTAPKAGADRYTVGAAVMGVPAPGVLGNDIDHHETVEPHPTVTATGTMGAAAVDTPVAAAQVGTVLPAPARGLFAELVTAPAHGTLVLAGDGAFVYTPEPGYSGTDSFTYETSDFHGTSEVQTVTLEVLGITETAPATPTAAAPRSLAFTG